MIIILEGAERSGKTTIAKALEKRGFLYIKDVPHYQNMHASVIQGRQDAMFNFISACYKSNIDVVIDRYFISERVYCKKYRDKNEHDLSYTYYIEKSLSNMGAKLILTERDITEDYIEQHPIYHNEDSLKQLISSFKHEYDKTEIEDKYRINLKYAFEDSFFNFDTLEIILDNVLGVFKHDNSEEKIIKTNVKVHEAFNYDFYLASPFFNDRQIERMEFILNYLRESGYKVYAPYEHGIVKADESRFTISEIFNSNINAIDSCERVIAITDGKDMGTIWEAGYAYGKGKPVIYFAETLGNNPFNIMLSESGIGIFTDRLEFKEAVLRGDFTTTKDGIFHE